MIQSIWNVQKLTSICKKSMKLGFVASSWDSYVLDILLLHKITFYPFYEICVWYEVKSWISKLLKCQQQTRYKNCWLKFLISKHFMSVQLRSHVRIEFSKICCFKSNIANENWKDRTFFIPLHDALPIRAKFLALRQGRANK